MHSESGRKAKDVKHRGHSLFAKMWCIFHCRQGGVQSAERAETLGRAEKSQDYKEKKHLPPHFACCKLQKYVPINPVSLDISLVLLAAVDK